MYPTRPVRHAAWETLDVLFPVSMMFLLKKNTVNETESWFEAIALEIQEPCLPEIASNDSMLADIWRQFRNADRIVHKALVHQFEVTKFWSVPRQVKGQGHSEYHFPVVCR